MVCYDRIIFGLYNLKNLNIEKITFKVVQMKLLAMHINNTKLWFCSMNTALEKKKLI